MTASSDIKTVPSRKQNDNDSFITTTGAANDNMVDTISMG